MCDKKYPVVHQFTPTVAFGDGVANGVLLTQKLLREFGFHSDIFICSNYVDYRFKHDVKHLDEYIPNKNQVLLYHFSIGHSYHDKIMNFIDKKILVYHNITPSYFFSRDTVLYTLCKLGREQLRNSQSYFMGSYADSFYSLQELKAYGYRNSKVLPLLTYDNKKRISPQSQEMISKYASSYNIIFVGRIVSNKCQHQLVDVIYSLRQKNIKNIKLFLIGAVSEQNYYDFLKYHIENLELKEQVILTKKVDEKELHSYYKNADLYLSLSEHEGFGIPLLEAMRYDMPVFAYDNGGVETALGEKGLLKFKSPDKVSDLIMDVMENPHKRVEIIKYQKEHLKLFTYLKLKNDFENYLTSLGIEIPVPSKKSKNIQKKQKYYQIEGPFDSTYSLSIVNRNLAKSLNTSQDNVKLYSTEGYGDFDPDKDYIKRDVAVNESYKKKFDAIDVTIRNLYPPRTNAMMGYHKIIGPYGWEESVFPLKFVDNFNAKLTMVACMSKYVKDTMIKNGVKVPLTITGIGADHVLEHPAKSLPYNLPCGFKLLHISSCFPRKGVDILLEVFEQIAHLEISLVIKTFPNPHNNISFLVEKLPSHIRQKILLINEELSQSQINYLYENCDCLVAPSYGEGFGLPMAEAMLFNMPVITTAYGGQSDFCFEDTTWLVDYSFEKAQTHFKLFNSYWAKPDKKSLQETILKVFYADKLEIEKKTNKAKDYILRNYKWQDVAKRLKNSIENYEKPKKQKRAVAWVSSYNTKCGIAEYSSSLINYLKDDFASIQIFANRVKATEINDLLVEKGIERVWADRFDLDNLQLIDKLKNGSFTDLVIQFNFAFFSMKNLQEIIRQNLDKNIFLELHSVKDVTIKGLEASLKSISEILKKIDQIIVHNISDLNILKNFGIVQNVTLLPLGVNNYDSTFMVKKDDKPTIASFGFLLPHKGTLELIESFYYIKEHITDCRLLLLNSLYPSSTSKDYYRLCKQKIDELKLQDSVIFITDYLSQEEIIKRLSSATLLVLLYKETQESASASVRHLISTKRPVLVTRQNIFNDISDIIHFIKNDTPKGASMDIIEILSDTKRLYSKQKLQQEWIQENSWRRVALKYKNIIKSYTITKNFQMEKE